MRAILRVWAPPYIKYRLSTYYMAGLGYRLFVALKGPGYQEQPIKSDSFAESVENNRYI